MERLRVARDLHHVGVARHRPEAWPLWDVDAEVFGRLGFFVKRQRSLGAQLGEDAFSVGPHPVVDEAELDLVDGKVGRGNRNRLRHPASLRPALGNTLGQSSPMFGRNGGTPLSRCANNVGAAALIASMVHGLSSVASVTGRHPRRICTCPPITFTTCPVTPAERSDPSQPATAEMFSGAKRSNSPSLGFMKSPETASVSRVRATGQIAFTRTPMRSSSRAMTIVNDAMPAFAAA